MTRQPTRRGLLAAGLTAATAGCGGVVPDADDPPTETEWPTRGGDPAGSYHTTASGAPTDDPELLWRATADEISPGQEPIVYGGRIYPAQDTPVRVETATGAVDRDGVSFRSTPAVAVSDGYRNATVVGLRNTHASETLLGPEFLGAFVAVNADPVAGPRTRWRWRYPGPPGAVTPWDMDSPVAPVAAGDRVLFGGRFYVENVTERRAFGGVVAVDTGSGRTLWRHRETDDGDPVPFGRPSVYDGRVYVGSLRGTVYGFELAGGRRVWTHGLDDDVRSPAAVVGAPDAVVTVTPNALVGLDHADGTQLWRTPFEGRFDPATRQAITVGDGSVYLPINPGGGNETALSAFDAATGERQWRVVVARLSGTPVLADGLLYYGDGGGVAAHAAADGSRQFRTDVDGAAALGTPAIDDDALYVVGDGTVYALGGT
ncbi:PQQ-binding-like beta-propeller repeat protein [Halobaculum sp. MBLA0143]|uniref:outer membrane protein assembly factor BamB family protein n=1 Tax=Halobaculum sp. MBLA0143 TaxID=3079933 RepID=UPI0035264069